MKDPPPPDVCWMGNGRAPRQEPTMSQMWEVVHQLAAKAGLRMALSRPVDAHRKGPRVAPPKDTPVV